MSDSSVSCWAMTHSSLIGDPRCSICTQRPSTDISLFCPVACFVLFRLCFVAFHKCNLLRKVSQIPLSSRIHCSTHVPMMPWVLTDFNRVLCYWPFCASNCRRTAQRQTTNKSLNRDRRFSRRNLRLRVCYMSLGEQSTTLVSIL